MRSNFHCRKAGAFDLEEMNLSRKVRIKEFISKVSDKLKHEIKPLNN
jgi:hypothetical protein